MTLASYFARKFLISFIRVFSAIALLVLLFDFLTNLNRLSGLYFPVRNALHLSFLRTTTYLSLAMPLIIMLSSLAFSVGLTRSNEFVISRASGLSAMKSLLSVILCTLVIGIISIFLFDPMANRMVNAYDKKLNLLQTSNSPKVLINDNGYWMRQSTNKGHQIIKAKYVTNNGLVLHKIIVFNYNKNGKIIERFFSNTAFLKTNELVLTQGKKWSDEKMISDPKKGYQTYKTYRIKTDITPTQLLAGYAAPETISPLNMNQQILKIKSSGFSILKYQSKQMEHMYKSILNNRFYAGFIWIYIDCAWIYIDLI